jgi:hypothetical protein
MCVFLFWTVTPRRRNAGLTSPKYRVSHATVASETHATIGEHHARHAPVRDAKRKDHRIRATKIMQRAVQLLSTIAPDGSRLARARRGYSSGQRRRPGRAAHGPTHFMHPHQEKLVHARQLRADIAAAPDVWLPRRDILITWLDTFLTRIAAPKSVLGETDAADLVALERFLRHQKVPAA